MRQFNCVMLVATLALLLMTHSIDLTSAKRTLGGSNRKSSGGSSTRRQSTSNSGHVTKPSYNTNSGPNQDNAKLSYSNTNSQPANSAAGAAGTQNQNIGWNVPKQQGPPPAYSANNPAGGAKTNLNEAPPAYRPNNAPSYGQSPITATNTHGLQSGNIPAGASYYPAGGVPAGASYYPSAGHAPAGASYYPAGGMPAGASYYPSGGHLPAGASYYPAGGVPAGASYYPSAGQLPAGATYYSSPPQSSSGLGFGSGLAAGAIGGALLGHALTPSQTRVVESAPAGAGGSDRVIIINNGQPGAVTSSDGTTVINAGGSAPQQPQQPAQPAAAGDATNAQPAIAPVPLAPFSGAATTAENTTSAAPVDATATQVPPAAQQPEQPPAGGIICVPVRVNDTDPNDSTKMIEVEKVACYPAPPPPPAAPLAADANAAAPPAAGEAPLAPMNEPPGSTSQQLQQSPTQATLMQENASVRINNSGTTTYTTLNLLTATLLSIMLSFGRNVFAI